MGGVTPHVTPAFASNAEWRTRNLRRGQFLTMGYILRGSCK
jgi:hypothetical protein